MMEKSLALGFIRSKHKIMLDLKLVQLDNLKSRIFSQGFISRTLRQYG